MRRSIRSMTTRGIWNFSFGLGIRKFFLFDDSKRFFRRGILFFFFFPRSWKICIGITGSGLIVFRQSGGGNIDACSGMNLGIERSFLWNKCFHRNFQLRAVTPFPLIRSEFRGRNRIFFYSQQFYILFLSFTYVHVGPFFCSTFTSRQSTVIVHYRGRKHDCTCRFVFPILFLENRITCDSKPTHMYTSNILYA